MAVLVQTGNTLLTLMTLSDLYTFTGQPSVYQKKSGQIYKAGREDKGSLLQKELRDLLIHQKGPVNQRHSFGEG